MSILIDAITQQSQECADKFSNAVLALNEALEAKHIWNVDYEALKYTLTNGGDDALDVLNNQLRQPNGYPEALGNDWWDFTSCYPHEAASRLKKISKYRGIVNQSVDTFLNALVELAEIGAKMKMIKTFIEKGRKPAENPVEVDYSGCGTCALCGKLHKLTKGHKMVHHGYRRPGDGAQYGDCFGVGYAPYELSHEGNDAFAISLNNQLKNKQTYLGELLAHKVDMFYKAERVRVKDARGYWTYQDKFVEVNRGEEGFDALEENATYKVRADISSIKQDIIWNNSKIANWVLKPLPYGEAK